jgi:hypothetical protein
MCLLWSTSPHAWARIGRIVQETGASVLQGSRGADYVGSSPSSDSSTVLDRGARTMTHSACLASSRKAISPTRSGWVGLWARTTARTRRASDWTGEESSGETGTVVFPEPRTAPAEYHPDGETGIAEGEERPRTAVKRRRTPEERLRTAVSWFSPREERLSTPVKRFSVPMRRSTRGVNRAPAREEVPRGRCGWNIWR